MIVKSIPIDAIHIKDRARIDKGDIEGLAGAIKEKGLIQPITLDWNMNLIAGERRLLACKHIGMTHIDAVIREGGDKLDSTEVELMENVERKDMTWQERARLEKRIWDHKAEKEGWTMRKQAELMQDAASAVNRRLQIAEAMEIMPELAEHEDFNSAWKELKKLEEHATVGMLKDKVPEEVKQAAKWAKDHYRIGDCFTALDKCTDAIANFAEVDPPYAIDLTEGGKRGNRDRMSDNELNYHEVPAEEYVAFYERIAKVVYRILKPNSFAVFWYGITWHGQVLDILRKAGFGVPDVPAVWTKGSSGQSMSPDTNFANCYETFFLARKGQPKLPKAGRSNVFAYSPVSAALKIHRTEKPIDLMLEIITSCCWPGSLISVPFLGSGVTLRAAYMLGHTGWGYDLEERNKNLFLAKVAEDQKMMEEQGVE